MVLIAFDWGDAMEANSLIDLRQFIGERVKKTRLAKGLTQERACARCTVSVDQWSRVENGAAPNPTLGTLVEIANALGVDVAEFFPQPGTRPLSPTVTEFVDFLEGQDEDAVRKLLHALLGLERSA